MAIGYLHLEISVCYDTRHRVNLAAVLWLSYEVDTQTWPPNLSPKFGEIIVWICAIGATPTPTPAATRKAAASPAQQPTMQTVTFSLSLTDISASGHATDVQVYPLEP